MSAPAPRGYAELQDVLLDADFPDVDVALRRGRHVDRDDVAWYALLSDGQALLEPLYRRYGCELVHRPDGFFYLVPVGDRVSRRQLAPGDMLVGQALTLLYLDPAVAARGGRVGLDDVVTQLVAVLGAGPLVATFNPSRKRVDERAAERVTRAKIGEAVRRLATLGFVEAEDEGRLRLRAALMRFAEPVRGQAAPAEALAALVASGEIVFEDAAAPPPERDDDEVVRDDEADDADAPDDDDGDDDDEP